MTTRNKCAPAFMRTDNEHHSFAVFQTTECRIDHHCYEVTDWNAIRDWGDRFAELRTPIKWGPGRQDRATTCSCSSTIPTAIGSSSPPSS